MMSSIPDIIRDAIEKHLSAEITGFSRSNGGCINNGGQLTTSRGAFFLKWNDADKFPEMFEVEKSGLNLLRSTNSVRIPKIQLCAESGQFQFLLLELILEGGRSLSYWQRLGLGLAALHRNQSESFGLELNNYIGSLPQQNGWNDNGIKFFIEKRLVPQADLAFRERQLPLSLQRSFDFLYGELSNLLPDEKPSLLHGDLWRGNVIVDESGNPVLIDPAVYYGYREADIAFTKLFGGFSSEFYAAYEEAFPLSDGHQNRVDLFNLYPLLAHVNLFGPAYAPQVISVLKKYTF